MRKNRSERKPQLQNTTLEIGKRKVTGPFKVGTNSRQFVAETGTLVNVLIVNERSPVAWVGYRQHHFWTPFANLLQHTEAVPDGN